MQFPYINEKDIFYFNFFTYGTPFLGSYRGMHFKIAKEEKKDETAAEGEEKPPIKYFGVTIWKGPDNLKVTKEEKTMQEFPFNEEGLQQVLGWLNEVYESRIGTWK